MLNKKIGDGSELIDKVIFQIQKGNNTFDKLIKNLSGIYPLDLKNILVELIKEDKVIVEGSKYALPSSISNFCYDLKEKFKCIDPIYNEFVSSLTPPHPVDFEWRFSLNAVKFIFENVFENHLVHNKNILFIAAPLAGMYFLIANNHMALKMNVTIVDRNSQILDIIEKGFKNTTICHDLQYELLTDIKTSRYDIYNGPQYLNW